MIETLRGDKATSRSTNSDKRLPQETRKKSHDRGPMDILGLFTKAKQVSKMNRSLAPFQSSHSKNEIRSNETHMQNNKNAEHDDSITKSSALERNKKAPHQRTAFVHPVTPLQIEAAPEAFNFTLQSIDSTSGQTATSLVDTTVALPQDLPNISSPPGNAQWQISETWKKLGEFYQWYPDMKGRDDEPLETAVEQITLKLANMYRKQNDNLDRLKKEANQVSSLTAELKSKAGEVRAHEITILKKDRDLEIAQDSARKYRNQVNLLNHHMEMLENEKLNLKNQLLNTELDRDQKIKSLEAKITCLNKRAEEERKTLQDRLENQKAMLNERHQVATKELRSAAEDLKQAFVAREHFKGLRDRDITGKFTRLATEVEDISTLEWDNSDTGNWPLSESQLLQIHPNNIRMLKQQIVQSSIWLLLYRHVMQSPFRIMGTEGQQVDEAWQEIWSSEDSFGWPEISAEMEKSRYEQARMFLTAIEPSTKSSPENLNLKSSHEIAVEKARNELHYALGRVSHLSERDRKILNNMVRLCAKIWLECCSQRYRLLVAFPDGLDGLDDLLMSPRRDLHSLRLLVKPNIKRFGTSQGGNITTGEIVTGWNGLVERYPKH